MRKRSDGFISPVQLPFEPSLTFAVVVHWHLLSLILKSRGFLPHPTNHTCASVAHSTSDLSVAASRQGKFAYSGVLAQDRCRLPRWTLDRTRLQLLKIKFKQEDLGACNSLPLVRHALHHVARVAAYRATSDATSEGRRCQMLVRYMISREYRAIMRWDEWTTRSGSRSQIHGSVSCCACDLAALAPCLFTKLKAKCAIGLSPQS